MDTLVDYPGNQRDESGRLLSAADRTYEITDKERNALGLTKHTHPSVTVLPCRVLSTGQWRTLSPIVQALPHLVAGQCSGRVVVLYSATRPHLPVTRPHDSMLLSSDIYIQQLMRMFDWTLYPLFKDTMLMNVSAVDMAADRILALCEVTKPDTAETMFVLQPIIFQGLDSWLGW